MTWRTFRFAVHGRSLARYCCAVLLACASTGCLPHNQVTCWKDGDFEQLVTLATEIEHPDVDLPADEGAASSIDPTHVPEGEQAEYWDLCLQEALWLALEHSKVMRDLGATVLRSPDSVETVFDPALQETDPRFGIEAALSEFDAQFKGSLLGEKNDRRFNNRVFGDRGFLQQDLLAAEAEIRKSAVTGSQFAVRHGFNYDNNNSPTNEYPHSWDAILEAEVRQPLLQGAGVAFNRIAGPNSPPGAANGVLIARTKVDMSLAEFERGVRDFLSNVENAYWDLYFAYRDLDAKKMARDASLETWRYISARTPGKYDRAKEAQALEQFLRFEQEVYNSLKGRPLDGTRTYSGSRPGTFRGVPGVRVAERRLRLLLGLPISDQRLIRTADEPKMVEVLYCWDDIAAETLVRRPELRRQRWHVKRRELELLASKNHLLPRLDLVGRYRWQGFGEDLLGPAGATPDPFDNAYENLFDGNFQEWQVGVELSAPIGYRQAFTAVRNAELRLAREQAILQEEERQAIHDLSNSVAELQRAWENYQLSFQRADASRVQMNSLKAAGEADRAELDVELDAQRRFADAVSRYYRARAEYAVALKNVHYEKGSLLEYHGARLAEGPWQQKAYCDAYQRERSRGRDRPATYVANPPLTAGGDAAGPHIEMPAVDGTYDVDAMELEPVAPLPGEMPPADLMPAGFISPETADEATGDTRHGDPAPAPPRGLFPSVPGPSPPPPPQRDERGVYSAPVPPLPSVGQVDSLGTIELNGSRNEPAQMDVNQTAVDEMVVEEPPLPDEVFEATEETGSSGAWQPRPPKVEMLLQCSDRAP